MIKIFNFQFSIFNFVKHPLFAGSAIMIVGSNGINFLNYIYHLIMGRLLGPASYGELSALFSLIGLIGVIPGSLSLVFIKYTASSKSKNDVIKIISWFEKKLIIAAVILFILFGVSSIYISRFLNIENYLLVIIASSTFLFSLPALLYKSVLQGVLRFKQLVFSNLTDTGVKLFMGVFLVYLGFSISGAVSSLILAGMTGLILSRIFIRDYLTAKVKTLDLHLDTKPIFIYAFPVLLQSVATTSLFSTDLMLVKHFFSPHEAGIYAALSSLSRIILFGAGPVGSVMFPLVSKRFTAGGDYKKILYSSFLLTSFIALGVLFFYWIFPEFAIKALYGSLYIEGASILVWFAVFMTLFTLAGLIVSFYLSLGQTKVIYFPLAASAFQIIGIWFYHNNLLEVILVSVVVSSVLFISLLLYFLHSFYTILKNR